MLSWDGRPGVSLQSTTNLAGTVWQDVANTDGQVTTTLTPGGKPTFFRLVSVSP